MWSSLYQCDWDERFRDFRVPKKDEKFVKYERVISDVSGKMPRTEGNVQGWNPRFLWSWEIDQNRRPRSWIQAYYIQLHQEEAHQTISINFIKRIWILWYMLWISFKQTNKQIINLCHRWHPRISELNSNPLDPKMSAGATLNTNIHTPIKCCATLTNEGTGETIYCIPERIISHCNS